MGLIIVQDDISVCRTIVKPGVIRSIKAGNGSAPKRGIHMLTSFSS